MKIVRHRQFKKNYKSGISTNLKLVERYAQRLRTFVKNPNLDILHDHSLIGRKKGYRAFSVTGDIRVVYKKEGNVITFYDIGSHNQVY